MAQKGKNMETCFKAEIERLRTQFQQLERPKGIGLIAQQIYFLFLMI